MCLYPLSVKTSRQVYTMHMPLHSSVMESLTPSLPLLMAIVYPTTTIALLWLALYDGSCVCVHPPNVLRFELHVP